MIMKFLFASGLLCFLLTGYVFSQENPKIDIDIILNNSGEVEPEFVREKLKEGDKYYKREFYEGSFRAYHDLYKKVDTPPALNYKLGVSALLGGKANQSADFLLESLPAVADDYYLQLGYAFQANLEYERARDAFEKYNNTLSKWAKKRFRPKFSQLLDECEFGIDNTSDSIPAFVINAGPAANSYYHEYGAVENSRHNRVFYTTRRPDRLPDIPGSRDEFEERILEASYEEGEFSEGVEVSKLNSRFNSGVAGISHDEDFLFVYRGKKRGGQVRIADITGKKVTKPSKISGRVDHKIFKETAFAETNDGQVFFVSDRRGGEGGKDIWTAQRRGHGRFSRPQNLGADINTPFEEEALYVTPDGKTLYFASNGHPGFGGFDVYETNKNSEGEWETPENLGQPINSPQDDLFFFPTSDQLVAFIASSRPGGYGGLDIYRIKKDLRIPFTIIGNVEDQETGASLYAKLSLVDKTKGQEITSIFSDSVSGEYKIALADTGNYVLQASAEDYKMEIAPVVSPTERNVTVVQDFNLEKLQHPYSLSGRISDLETEEPLHAEIIFKDLDKDSVTNRIFSDRNTGEYSITFEDKFNLTMIVSAADYYEFSTDLMLQNTEGSSEVKDVELELSVKGYTLSGKIVETETNDPVPGELAVYKPEVVDPVVVNYADSVTGNYSFTVYDTGPFLVEVNADGYFFNNLAIEFHPDTTLKVKNIEMQPMSTGASIVAENILFTTGKATLRAESYPELDRLVRLLKENPSVRIEVSGHTDNTGSASLNKRLSRDRALSVKRYLESQGIDPERIEYEGYGFEKPIAPNTTPEGRAKNRRVEIEVI